MVDAKPVIAAPKVKRAVQARKRFVGRKMVASLPIRGFVHEEAICSGVLALTRNRKMVRAPCSLR